MPPAGTVRSEGAQGIMTDFSYPGHRRSEQRAQPALRAGDLVLDEARWTVHRAGRQVDLSPTEFRLLAYLMRNQGQVLTRAQLLENVWGWNRSGQSQIVETYVSYLRRKLDAFGPRLIHTRRGVGYLLRSAGGGITTPYRDESLRLS
jgi:two-component system, OmpR family, response regulator